MIMIMGGGGLKRRNFWLRNMWMASKSMFDSLLRQFLYQEKFINFEFNFLKNYKRFFMRFFVYCWNDKVLPEADEI